MVQTTFRLLGADQPDTDPILISSVEGVTGAWPSYGLDTPINVLSILDHAGLETAITCLYASLTDNRDLAKNIGLAVVQAHLYAYSNALPNDSRIFDLLYFCNLYLQSLDVQVPARVDYCGNPLGTSGPVSLAQILSIAANIQTTIDGLNQVGTLPVYPLMIAQNGPFTADQLSTSVGNQILSIDSLHPVNDPANQIAVGVTGYVTTPISQLSTNADTFLSTGISYEADSPVYYLAQVQYQNPNITPVDYSNRAAFEMGTAAILTSQQLSSNNGMLLNLICNQVKAAITDYNALQRQKLDPQVSYYQQLARGMPAGSTGIAQWDTDGQIIMNAGLNRRAALLRDAGYMGQFDTGGVGNLNASDRLTAEKAIQGQMLLAREAAALPFYNAVLAAYNAFTVQTDIVNLTVRTYLL